MKKLFLAAAALLFLNACTTPPTVTIHDPDSSSQMDAAVELTVLPSFNPNSDIRIGFKPGADVVKWEYAIGSADDLADFATGRMEVETVFDNLPANILFDGLAKNSRYMVFARAYTPGSEEPGAISSAVAHTSEVNLTVTESFLGSESAAYNIAPGLEYRAIEYALESSPDNIGDFTAIFTVNDPYRPYVATFFDLKPDTDYYLLVRAQDRFGDWSNTLATKITTRAFDQVPGVTVTTNHSDFFIVDDTFTPNSKTQQYCVFFSEQGPLDLDGSIMSTNAYNGDYLAYIKKQAESLEIHRGEKAIQFLNVYLTLDIKYEYYILLYDQEGNATQVVRKRWSTPSYDPSADVAKVDILAVVPSTTGGIYEWGPNDATHGFFFETFAAELIDGNDPNDPGPKDETWIREWFIENKNSLMMDYKFNYRYLTEFPGWWEKLYFEESGGGFASGAEFVIYVMPLNKNGIMDGVGEITSYRYRKL